MQSTPLAERVLVGIRMLAGGAFTTLLVLFFVLVSGEIFLRRLVEILPRFKDKKQLVDISQQIEADISVYLATITMMNTLVGIATGVMAWLCGLGDPLLWGTFAFLLNYVPVLGPTAGVMIFLVVGLVSLDPLWFALLPAALYLLIHVAEGETVTPMLLASRFTLRQRTPWSSATCWRFASVVTNPASRRRARAVSLASTVANSGISSSRT